MAELPHRYVRVTAPEGRRTPIHEDDGVDVGAVMLYVEPGSIRRVRWSQTVRRARNRGDLILCDMNGNRVDTVDLAEQVEDLPGGKLESQFLHAHEHHETSAGFRTRLVSRPVAVERAVQPTPSKEA